MQTAPPSVPIVDRTAASARCRCRTPRRAQCLIGSCRAAGGLEAARAAGRVGGVTWRRRPGAPRRWLVSRRRADPAASGRGLPVGARAAPAAGRRQAQEPPPHGDPAPAAVDAVGDAAVGAARRRPTRPTAATTRASRAATAARRQGPARRRSAVDHAVQRRELRRRAGAAAAQRGAARARRAAHRRRHAAPAAVGDRRAPRAWRRHLHGAGLRRPVGRGLVGDGAAGIPGADADIVSTVRGWRYKPQPIPVCFVTQFLYEIQ